MRLSPKIVPIVFGLLLSGMMSFVVSGISTLRLTGFEAGFMAAWMQNWSFSWAVAFPTVLVVAPMVRRLLSRLGGA
ncbi:MAG: DUF2798 domain-containing protein [Pseudomonadota bacterium]